MALLEHHGPVTVTDRELIVHGIDRSETIDLTELEAIEVGRGAAAGHIWIETSDGTVRQVRGQPLSPDVLRAVRRAAGLDPDGRR